MDGASIESLFGIAAHDPKRDPRSGRKEAAPEKVSVMIADDDRIADARGTLDSYNILSSNPRRTLKDRVAHFGSESDRGHFESLARPSVRLYFGPASHGFEAQLAFCHLRFGWSGSSLCCKWTR